MNQIATALTPLTRQPEERHSRDCRQRATRTARCTTAVHFWFLSLLVLFIASGQLYMGLAHAEPRTLGGPIATADGVRQSDSKTAITPVHTPTTGSVRLAQEAGSSASSEDANQASPAQDRASSIAALGTLPIDLAEVRRVQVAGRSINETPLRVGNLDLLAPIVGLNSSILSGLGATAERVRPGNIPGNLSTPTADQMFQINLPDPQAPPIIFVIGKATAYVNNIEQTLRAAPLVIRGKIWLPVFSIAPLLGASVRLEPGGTLHVNPTVQSVELFPVKGYTVLTIKTSAPLRPGAVLMGTLSDPPKLYLDFKGYSMGFDAAGSTGQRVVSGGLSEVQRARAGLFEGFPDTTRVVLDLTKNMTGSVQSLPNKTLFALLLVPPGGVNTISDPYPNRPGSLSGLKIVVDAGHGGHDSGARGARSVEKNHTLEIAQRVRRHLEALGATVMMTRDTDHFISLQGRVDYANARRADIFFSVHINSFRPTSSGTETFFWTAQSASLAREVQKELVRATGLPNRGVSQARFYVIRKTSMPSVLTETAFISNSREEAKLMDPQFRERVARGMAQGIANYANRYLSPTDVLRVSG